MSVRLGLTPAADFSTGKKDMWHSSMDRHHMRTAEDTDYIDMRTTRNRWKQSGIREDNQTHGDTWGRDKWPERRGGTTFQNKTRSVSMSMCPNVNKDSTRIFCKHIDEICRHKCNNEGWGFKWKRNFIEQKGAFGLCRVVFVSMTVKLNTQLAIND